jgi:hypothetical protein
MSAIERFIKATDAAWASASWATEDVASASAAMNDYMKARDILRGELAAREWVGMTDEELHDLQIEHLDDPWANFKAIEQALKDKNT